MPFLKRLLQYRWTLSLLILAVFPFTMRGAIKAFQGVSNRIVDWMPEDFQATQDYYRFFGLFGSDELLMISWDGCTLDDARIEPFRQALLAPAETRDGQRPLFRKVITGADVLELYQAEPLQMEREEALGRMSGWIVSPDRAPEPRLTCLIALVATGEWGEADRHAAVAHVRKSAGLVPGLSSDSVHVAGSTIEVVAIDEASQSRLLLLNIGSYVICILIMAFCLKNLRAAFIVLVIALFNEQLSMALIHYTGTQMNSILLLTANLTFVLTISICIHLVNYYKDALRVFPANEAPLQACRVALQPTLLATLTTSLGLISLTASRILPINQFGLYSAVSLIVAMGVAIVYTALHFSIWPLRQPVQPTPAGEIDESSPALDRWVRMVRMGRWPIIAITLTVLVIGYFGVRKLRTSVGLKELLRREAPVVQDYIWLEENIGPLNPVEIVLAMPSVDEPMSEEDRPKATMEQFRTVAALHDALSDAYRQNAVISSASFVPDLPDEQTGGFRQVALRAAFRRKLMEGREDLRALGYWQPAPRADDLQPKHDYWRITMRCPAMADVDYGQLLQQVQQTIDDALEDSSGTRPAEVIVCGGVPLVYQAQRQLLKDLIHSFLLAFALVSLTLMLLFGSFRCGLICMIPNVLPAALVFGLMGWRGTPIEFGTILTASAAMGIAVDDSLHFITWFRRKVSAGGSIREAVWYSYRRCGAAMVHTTLICSFGLVVFAFSPFAPIAYFGWCMFALLAVALVADLVVLPAILLSPLGRPFLPRDPAKAPTTLPGFAWRVAGPREFLIVSVINIMVAVWVFHRPVELPLVALWSYFGPMSFILSTLTVFFGLMNGVNERRGGRVEPKWPAGGRWMGKAAIAGLVCGVCMWLVCFVTFQVLGRVLPSVVVPKWWAIFAIGLTAGILGYLLHSLAVICSGLLHRDQASS
jgi:predicted RND superfamily exporter protein